jgi:hypothetical protein
MVQEMLTSDVRLAQSNGSDLRLPSCVLAIFSRHIAALCLHT